MDHLKPPYCTVLQAETCRECALSSYGKDCHNRDIVTPLQGKVLDMIDEVDRLQSRLLSLLTPKQREEWDSIEHLADVGPGIGYAYDHLDRAKISLDNVRKGLQAGGR